MTLHGSETTTVASLFTAPKKNVYMDRTRNVQFNNNNKKKEEVSSLMGA